jgi:O-antigen/teichoic acid export membrane protein
VFVVLSVPIIDMVLNSSFRPGATSMQILAIYAYMATIIIPFYYLVLGTDRPVLIAKVYTASSLINIALNFLLIPRNGLLSGLGVVGPAGAATATLLSSFILFAGTYHYSRKVAGRPLLEGRMLKHFAAGLAAGVFIWWLGGMVDPMHWYHLIALSFACLGIYVGALMAMGEFGRADLDFFTETISPVKLLRYIVGELRGRKDGKEE